MSNSQITNVEATMNSLKLNQLKTELMTEHMKLKGLEAMKANLEEQIQASKTTIFKTKTEIDRLEGGFNGNTNMETVTTRPKHKPNQFPTIPAMSTSSSYKQNEDIQYEESRVLVLSFNENTTNEEVWSFFMPFGKINLLLLDNDAQEAIIRFADEKVMEQVIEKLGKEVEFGVKNGGRLSIDVRNVDSGTYEPRLGVSLRSRLKVGTLMNTFTQYGTVTDIRYNPGSDMMIALIGFLDDKTVVELLGERVVIGRDFGLRFLYWSKQQDLQQDEEMHLLVSSTKPMTKELLWCTFSRFGTISNIKFKRNGEGRIAYGGGVWQV
eukprot:TRINITY_DN614_c0_g1_i17.p3 TRINITY_DN614_c0_g1~~TRINITY_DN614_c0_g1_i17.p3  ORF type:complete len:323 (+),score=111.61 TRINITY_DN614_c0_g1_i17:786-1754(+)